MPTHINFERLYDDHAQALFAFLISLTRNDADTRDLLQEVFVKVAQRPEVLEGVNEPRAFLLRLARNAAIDLARRRDTRQQKHERLAVGTMPVFAPSAEPDQEAFRVALSAALEDLPEEQRTVVHLKLWERLTFQQIAEILSLSPNTVASRYRYGIDKLRQQLRPLYDEIK